MKAISGTNLEQAKSHNRRVVIEAIRTSGPLSRAALAKLTALSTRRRSPTSSKSLRGQSY